MPMGLPSPQRRNLLPPTPPPEWHTSHRGEACSVASPPKAQSLALVLCFWHVGKGNGMHPPPHPGAQQHRPPVLGACLLTPSPPPPVTTQHVGVCRTWLLPERHGAGITWFAAFAISLFHFPIFTDVSPKAWLLLYFHPLQLWTPTNAEGTGPGSTGPREETHTPRERAQLSSDFPCVLSCLPLFQ